MSGFSAIDLSKLQASEVIQTVEYVALLAEMKAEAVRLMPELDPFLSLESEPASKILRVCAYFRMLDRLEFNDNAKALMLAKATGGSLDQLAAFWGVERLTVQAADDTVSPPIPEIRESDEAFRQRTQLSLEGHTTAGPRGSYIFWALSASGEVKDVSVERPVPGQVVVTVLSHADDGTPSSGLLNTVETALNDEDIRPLCDTVVVQAVTVVPYEVEAVLTLYEGPGEAEVLAAAEAALEAYIEAHHRIGHDITLSGLFAALHQPGVQNVQISKPVADVVIGSAEAAFCMADSIAVTVGGRDV
ncbi:MAG: baseplate J/gp47 family protein [Ruegeria sp.]|uniref:baseplate assembly protein n=1 Tax=Ruegeria sp. TaxID=1879320 RepID=UPI00349E6B32